MKKIFFLIVLFCLSVNLFAENNQSDSLLSNKKKFEMTKSPTNAILYSLIFPGAGQIYTENYWKAPLFAIGSGILVYFIIDNNKSYNNYEDLYQNSKAINPLSLESLKYKSYKEYYRDIRDQSAFYLLAVYIVAAVDAYVGAHLYDFDVSDQVKLNIFPEFDKSIAKLNLKIKF